ncbi:hypothetical protein QZH41_006070 [Actinostola sp. cb2023]|nr:hypothetical protein QZH41_006070 [Actinostola sp. cb2023]
MDVLLVNSAVPFMCSHDSGATARQCPMRIVICHHTSTESIPQAAAGLTKLGCDVQLMECSSLPGNLQVATTGVDEMTPEPSNKLVGIISTVEKVFNCLDCKLYRGDVYCKPRHSAYAYVYYKTLDAFLNYLTANRQLAEDLVGNIPAVSNILASDDCVIIPQLKIDFNLIEVLPTGTCFNIAEKRFLTNAIDDNQLGKFPSQQSPSTETVHQVFGQFF